MNFIDLIILSIALGVDCLLVSFSQGILVSRKRRLVSLLLAATMGLFQGIMPAISYFFTDFVDEFVEPYGAWIVFTIFMCLAFKIFTETFYGKEEADEVCYIGLNGYLLMGVATSVDALASGINLQLTDTPIVKAAIIIGLGSFIMSLSGFWGGNFLKKLPSKILGTFGCLILIFLAFKSLI
ncbi:manganese efflux pump [bacterium]|nr:manganese efflux pump [bacterium]